MAKMSLFRMMKDALAKERDELMGPFQDKAIVPDYKNRGKEFDHFWFGNGTNKMPTMSMSGNAIAFGKDHEGTKIISPIDFNRLQEYTNPKPLRRYINENDLYQLGDYTWTRTAVNGPSDVITYKGSEDELAKLLKRNGVKQLDYNTMRKMELENAVEDMGKKADEELQPWEYKAYDRLLQEKPIEFKK